MVNFYDGQYKLNFYNYKGYVDHTIFLPSITLAFSSFIVHKITQVSAKHTQPLYMVGYQCTFMCATKYNHNSMKTAISKIAANVTIMKARHFVKARQIGYAKRDSVKLIMSTI